MLTKDTKLMFWCQKVLPLVYDDSLSYYELLNKVVLHLNQHTEDINALIDFYDTFAEDVEDIIEQMMEDGDFNAIISNTVGGMIAPEYDPTQTYVALNYVINNSKLYCCTDTTTGEWDETKWRETDIGYELNTLMQRAFNLNAGQISYSGTATYDNGTVGKELQDLDSEIDSLDAGDVGYNSATTYESSTVGKELKDLNTALNAKIVRYSGVTLSSSVTSGQIARVPSSGTDSKLTEDSTVLEATFSNPSAILSNITVQKYEGYFTLVGTTGTSAGTVDIKMGNP